MGCSLKKEAGEEGIEMKHIILALGLSFFACTSAYTVRQGEAPPDAATEPMPVAPDAASACIVVDPAVVGMGADPQIGGTRNGFALTRVVPNSDTYSQVSVDLLDAVGTVTKTYDSINLFESTYTPTVRVTGTGSSYIAQLTADWSSAIYRESFFFLTDASPPTFLLGQEIRSARILDGSNTAFWLQKGTDGCYQLYQGSVAVYGLIAPTPMGMDPPCATGTPEDYWQTIVAADAGGTEALGLKTRSDMVPEAPAQIVLAVVNGVALRKVVLKEIPDQVGKSLELLDVVGVDDGYTVFWRYTEGSVQHHYMSYVPARSTGGGEPSETAELAFLNDTSGWVHRIVWNTLRIGMLYYDHRGGDAVFYSLDKKGALLTTTPLTGFPPRDSSQGVRAQIAASGEIFGMIVTDWSKKIWFRPAICP